MSFDGSSLFDEKLIARRRLRRWAAGAVGVLVLIRLMAEVLPAMRVPDLVLLDAWQSLRGTQRPSPQVVIVAIDEKSIQKFGPMAWPRSEYVPLVERLSAAGAKVIGFDFTFGALEREAAHNKRFAAAMKKAGNVVFGYEFTDVGDPSPAGSPASAILQANALARFKEKSLPPAPSLIEPEPALAEAAAALGHVFTVAGDDGKIRVLPLLVQHGGKAYPSLALQLARVYMGTPLEQLHDEGNVVRMGALDIPVSPSGEVLLNWPAGGEKAFPHYSFLDVVRGDVPNEAFLGKAVLVAGTAAGLDDRDFPFAVEAPGVLIHATFLDNAFRFDFVGAPVWAWLLEWGLFVAACGLCVWLLPRLSTRLLLAGVPALALLLLGVAGFLFVQKGIWLQIVYPCLALLAPLGLVAVLRLTASERETRDVVAEKVENQKLLGLSFQEKGMLDMALATFNKLPVSDDMKLVYLHLGLDYENRGQRDKAYLVYKKVFDVDPRFEDVAHRMERLSQAGAGASIFGAPTGHLASAATAGQFGTPPPAATPQPTGPPPMSRSLAASLPPATPAPAPALDEDATALAPTATPAAARTVPDAAMDTSLPTRVAPGAAPTRPAPPTVVATPATFTPAPGGPVMPGSRFGRYQVESHIGRGGMGDVYLVRDTIINRQAALKTIRPDTDLDAKQIIEMRQRFYREAQTAGKLTHPHIVTVYDVGEDLGMSYIVMEFVEGQTLTGWMKKQRLSVPQIKHVIYNAGLGLAYAHENGVFHRDVKPDNIMLSKTGAVKVMDFGIARVVESSLTRTGSVMGTPAYMSPEQVNGQKVDGRSDIFSLGVILYELLTGRKPFKGDTMPSLMFAIMKEEPPEPSTVDTNVAPVWNPILKKALAKNRDERYATVKEFAQAVRDAPAR
ncbi:MAG TPA: serine/threonine-protein kinase [Vicinamibacteria bacterium]|nr:serine/threonine-protein kinase [Vicinamibacteria bacterium]